MAKAVKDRIDKLSQSMPEGYELTSIYDQGYESDVANQGFILNLIISVLNRYSHSVIFHRIQEWYFDWQRTDFLHLCHAHCHDGLRHRASANVTCCHHYRHGNAGGQCHRRFRLRLNQYGTRNAEACRHHARLLSYSFALIGGNCHRYSYLPPYLLFTTYHR